MYVYPFGAQCAELNSSANRERISLFRDRIRSMCIWIAQTLRDFTLRFGTRYLTVGGLTVIKAWFKRRFNRHPPPKPDLCIKVDLLLDNELEQVIYFHLTQINLFMFKEALYYIYLFVFLYLFICTQAFVKQYLLF